MPKGRERRSAVSFVTVLHEKGTAKYEIQSTHAHLLASVQSSNTRLMVTKAWSRQNYILDRSQGYGIKLSHIYSGNFWACSNTEILWTGVCGCTCFLEKR